MKNQSFDEQNQRDFGDVTERINEALLKMASDPSIKATVTQLAEIAGVHRNTVTNREWPVERVSAIKAQRKAEAERNKSKDKEPDAEAVLTTKLEKARLEILFWFRKYNEATALQERSNESIRYLSKTKDNYQQEIETLRQQLEAMKNEYEHVCDLLNTVKG